ncbi:hypothetical protein [Rhodovulum marinum]|uniref:Uncharacterized protein n=1 Tax=Rhodovulum marinum TaxID=320662 RepID=A0A4R2Q562_9RHOB|nr:hypothetical protein [Rhodovulum marinum]TCP42928.1 hypothetical protein EV662_102119 [Rhodovulum marinum]
MTQFRNAPCTAALAALVALSAPAHAQAAALPYTAAKPAPATYAPDLVQVRAQGAAPAVPGATSAFSTANTDRILRRIEAGREFCAGIAQREYVIDCLAAQFERVARALPGPDYRQVGQIIGTAAADLRRLAEANAAPDLPRGRVRIGGTTSPRALTPVRRDGLARLNRQASGILQEAETQLLRAAEGSARRQVHYQRIAAAIGSTKVLLRSV